jgi:hypothetical protein
LQAVLYYLSPYGFLCQATHSTDPNTGTSYRTEIVAALHKDGFGQIASGSTTNGWTNVSFCRGNTT